MKRHVLFGLSCALVMPAFAQAPPQAKPPVRAPAEQNRPDQICANATSGQNNDADTKKEPAQDRTLSDKLATSNGVICPPTHVDPAMRQSPPPGGRTPVIPPPGSPGGDPNIQPK